MKQSLQMERADTVALGTPQMEGGIADRAVAGGGLGRSLLPC